MKAYNFRLGGALYSVGAFLDQATQINKMTLRRSTNDGASWDQFTIASDKEGYGYTVLPNPLDDRVIYVGGEKYGTDGNPYAALFKTTDKGVTWNQIGTSLMNRSWEEVRALECDKSQPAKVFAGTNYGLYLSTDAGASWSQVIIGAYANNIVIDPTNTNNVFVATSGGVKLSTNGGTTWRDFNEFLTNLYVEGLDYDAVNKVLYAGTKNGGVFRRVLGPAVGVEENAMPVRAELYQNYPNPFNPSTTIKFAVARQGTYLLTVHSVLGQEVAVLLNGRMEAGSYSVQFDAQNLSSGTYFYRLEGGSSILTRKMIIVK